LLATAKGNGAPPEIMKILRDLSGSGEFGGPQEVMKAYSEERQRS
jgi:hypothetical protein